MRVTYGDVKENGKRLRELNKGDYLFFHTSIRNKRYITGYYVLETVIKRPKKQRKTDILYLNIKTHTYLKTIQQKKIILFLVIQLLQTY